VHIARGYLGYGLPMGDLVKKQCGPHEGVKRFDPRWCAPGVLSVHWIRAEIHEYVLRNWRL